MVYFAISNLQEIVINQQMITLCKWTPALEKKNFSPKKIKRKAVRETGVFRHHGGPNYDPRKTSREHLNTIVSRGIREGGLNWALIDASLSDNQCMFFS